MSDLSDDLDRAALVTQAAADREIANIRQQAANINTSNPTGKCWYCFEPTGHDRRWCDRDCADEWEQDN